MTTETATMTGYWTTRRLEIWRTLTPAQRDYDRYVGVYPPGQGAYETDGAREHANTLADEMQDDQTCRCHVSAPCSYCVDAREA